MTDCCQHIDALIKMVDGQGNVVPSLIHWDAVIGDGPKCINNTLLIDAMEGTHKLKSSRGRRNHQIIQAVRRDHCKVSKVYLYSLYTIIIVIFTNRALFYRQHSLYRSGRLFFISIRHLTSSRKPKRVGGRLALEVTIESVKKGIFAIIASQNKVIQRRFHVAFFFPT